MGLLDAPAVNPGKAGAHITAMMANNRQSIAILVLSDSTGVPQGGGVDDRWPYKLAQHLAAAFPTHTVNHRLWDPVGEAGYSAATVIQTGTGTGNGGGPWVLDIYNASMSGKTYSYWNGKMLTPTPVVATTMDLIIDSLGHNETGQGANVRTRTIPHLQILRQMAPGVPIALMTQNPQNGAGSASSTAEETNQLTRMSEIRKLARSEGVALIDVQPAFLANAGWASALVQADGVHPTPTGSVLWASEVARHFPVTRERFVPLAGGPSPALDRVWVPAYSMLATEGSPTFTHISKIPCVQLANGADSCISCSVDFPVHWRSLNTYLWWAPTTTSTNNWRVRLNNTRMGGTLRGDTSAAGLTLATPATGSTTSQAGNGVANRISVAQVNSGTDLLTGYTGRPMMFGIERLGTDGADLLASVVSIFGLMIARAS